MGELVKDFRYFACTNSPAKAREKAAEYERQAYLKRLAAEFPL